MFNDTDADVLWLVFGAPHEAANTLEMSEETLALLYPDGPKALPPELDAMTDRLHFTGNEEADRLLVEDPFALLVGFALDQQVPVQKAFMGPYVLRERLGLARRRQRSRPPTSTRSSASARRSIASRARWPRACTRWRVHVVERYDGRRRAGVDDAPRPTSCARTSTALPGFGTMKVKALGSVLAKRFGVELAEPLIPWHPTLGDVDSAAALADYQASKKVNKAAWEA